MAGFGVLEKIGLVFLIGLLFYLVKSVVNLVYTYIIGPAVNKVDFKSKGKWACKYDSYLFSYYINCKISYYVNRVWLCFVTFQYYFNNYIIFFYFKSSSIVVLNY